VALATNGEAGLTLVRPVLYLAMLLLSTILVKGNFGFGDLG
jgi:hypothetical protein